MSSFFQLFRFLVVIVWKIL